VVLEVVGVKGKRGRLAVRPRRAQRRHDLLGALEHLQRRLLDRRRRGRWPPQLLQQLLVQHVHFLGVLVAVSSEAQGRLSLLVLHL
jgi:hypothetical protein